MNFFFLHNVCPVVNRILRGAALVLTAAALAACAKTESSKDATSGAEAAFSLFGSGAQSALVETYRTLRESNDVVVCVGHVGYAHTSSKGVQRTEWARRAVVAWVAALQESPDWANKAQKNFLVTSQTGMCPDALVQGSRGFKIQFFGTAQDQVNATCGPASPQAASLRDVGLCRTSPLFSFASPTDRTAIISPRIGTRARAEDFLFETVLHEFGHILGLGDLYKGLNIDYEGAVPHAIMAYTASTLAADDKLGIWNIERATRTGQWGCGGHASARNLSSTNDNVYCRPSASALANASRAHAEMSATQERHALVGKRVKVTLLQNTTLKTADTDSSGLAADAKCGLAASLQLMGTLSNINATGNHIRIAFDAALASCPASLAQGGYFYAPHVRVEEALAEAPAPSTP